jgi:predicted small integral membrane protein
LRWEECEKDGYGPGNRQIENLTMDTSLSLFSWMAWTPSVAIFFVCIAVMLVAMTVWELRSPTTARRGLLPLVTTRGDRLFIGLLASAYINLAWAGLTDLSQWIAVAIAAATLLVVMRWG